MTGCTSLPLNREGLPPTTVIRVRSFKNHSDKQALATIGHTEIIPVCMVLSVIRIECVIAF